MAFAIERRAWIATAILASALLASVSPLGADYGNLGCHLNAPRCDEPAWPLEALSRLDFGTFVHQQPLMGPVSMVLRAPFAALARVFDANLTWHYRAGVFACLFVLALLALELGRRSRARGHVRLHTAAVVVLTFVNPLTVSAIGAGHPEELLAAAAVVASAILAIDGRSRAAGATLGVAVATKAWAILVVAPLFLMVPAQHRRRFAAAAAVILLLFYTPLAAGDTHRFWEVVQTPGSLGSRYGEGTAPDAWFFTTSRGDFTWPTAVSDGQIVYSDATGYRISDSEAHVVHALTLLLGLLLAWAWWRSGGDRRRETLLPVIGAVLLLRCLLDPGNHLYYHAAAATAVLAYEALRPKARFPWLAAWFIGALWVITGVSDHLRTDTSFSWVYLAFAVPTLAGLAFIACLRSRSIPPIPRLRISRRHATG